MSRIGLMPVKIEDDVTVSVDTNEVTVRGPKGELVMVVDDTLEVKIKDGYVLISRKQETDHARAMHGTTRAIIQNMVEGVKKGYEVELEMSGIGYRASMKGEDLSLSIGYTHPVIVKSLPGMVTFEVQDQVKIFIRGIDKQRVTQVAANIRKLKKPEPYKGKGIKYKGEVVRRKTPKVIAV